MRALLLAGVLAAGLAGSARAAVITENFVFSLGGFVDGNGSGTTPPVSVVNGSFTLTFDPTVQVSDSTSGLSNVSVTKLAPASIYDYSVFPAQNLLVFDESLSNLPAMYTAQSGLAVLIDISNPYQPALSTCSPNIACGLGLQNSAYLQSGYSLPGNPVVYQAATGQSSVTASPSLLTVPEPASFALLGLGVAGVAAVRRRRVRGG